MPTFSETDKAFKNAASIRIREISVSCPEAGITLESCRLLFQSLDRADPFQAALIRKVWRLRATALFTLLPFDAPSLGFSEMSREVARDARRVPALAGVADTFEESISALMRLPANPKYGWLTSGESFESLASGEVGFLSIVAMGRTYGWPGEEKGKLELPYPVRIVDSSRTLQSSLFNRLIVPGTCHYLSTPLFLDIFYKGRTESVDVLLYPGERFTLRERLLLPECDLFRNCINLTKPYVGRETPDKYSESISSDADEQIKEGLWQSLRGADGAPGPLTKPARYILFTDGRGVFVPNDTHVLLIPEGGSDAVDELVPTSLNQLSEGDLLAIQAGDCRALLDAASTAYGFDQKLESASDWRRALERLLLTVEPERVAEEMIASGAQGAALAFSIRNWADGTVYGPARQREFGALVSVLARNGKLPDLNDLDEYVTSHWRLLRELRGIRHRAGHSVHSELARQLGNALGKVPSLREGLFVNTDSGVGFELCRVAAVDDQVSWVPAAGLMELRIMGSI